MHPWYRGFTGTIEPKPGTSPSGPLIQAHHFRPHKHITTLPWMCLFSMLGRDTGSYLVTGSFRRVDDVTIEVIELPVKRWTQVRVS